jgi:hypothetical protein
MRLYIDDAGVTWRNGVPAVAQQQVSVEFAIKNLGVVLVDQHVNGVLVRWRPDVVNGLTFCALMYALADANPQRVFLETFEKVGWRQQLWLFDGNRTYQALAQMVRDPSIRATEWVIRRDVCVQDLVAEDPLRKIIEFWTAKSGTPVLPNDPALLTLLDDATHGRFVWVKDAAPDGLVFEFIGNGFLPAVKQTLSHSIGQPLEKMLDLRYGRYCVEAYGRAVSGQQPLLEDVDAYIDNATLGRPVRRTYRRVILPFRTAIAGETRLLGVSLDQPALDLRAVA